MGGPAGLPPLRRGEGGGGPGVLSASRLRAQGSRTGVAVTCRSRPPPLAQALLSGRQPSVDGAFAEGMVEASLGLLEVRRLAGWSGGRVGVAKGRGAGTGRASGGLHVSARHLS